MTTQTIWSASDIGPATITMKIPIDTSAGSSPGNLSIGELCTYILGQTSGITFPLAVNKGGSGVTTSTGSGNVVLSASPTLTGTLIVSAQTVSGILYLNGGVAESALYSNGNSSTSFALNLDNGNLQSITITVAVA